MEDGKKYEDVIPPNEGSLDDAAPPDTCSDAEKGDASKSSYQSEDLNPPVHDIAPGDSPSKEQLPAEAHQADMPFDATEYVKKIDGKLEKIAGTEERLFSEVREMHKLYHAEFAGRLKTMQEELEQYRKIDKGRAFDDILAAIARIYGNNETLADEVEEPKAKKSIKYMLLDIEDLLGVYGMAKLRSNPGEKRNPRHCQVLNRIPTNDPAMHDTVVKSYNSGFYIGNRTVIKEVVDVYILEGNTSVNETQEEQIIETSEKPVTE